MKSSLISTVKTAVKITNILNKYFIVFFFQPSDPTPIKKSKHEDFPSQSALADKERQHDWLQSLSASAKVGVAKPRLMTIIKPSA